MGTVAGLPSSRTQWPSLSKMTIGYLIMSILLGSVDTLEADPKGYILYCPCMGEFGQQAEHLLGALSFAHAMDRTLVLPPFIEYPRDAQYTPVLTPFSEYFSVEALEEYHRVITMEDFFNELAYNVWPENNRTVYCYGPRQGDPDATEDSCNAKHGSPYGPFWSRYDVEFANSVFYGPLHHGTEGPMLRDWVEQYSSNTDYVMAFTGAPSRHPIGRNDAKLQRYLLWSENMDYESDKFVADYVPASERPLLAIHVAGGNSWELYCGFILKTEDPSHFGQAQCFAHEKDGVLTAEMCNPSLEVIVNEVKFKVNATESRTVFVACANASAAMAIEHALERADIRVVQYEPYQLQVDMAILSKADYFLGNCVDPVSAFVSRERRVHQRKLDYWGWKSPDHDEL